MDKKLIKFRKSVQGLGDFILLPYSNDKHAAELHRWVNMDYARYWMLQNTTVEEVKSAYDEIQASGDIKVYMGFHNEKPAFLLEFYDARAEEVAKHYDVEDGDYGMHILVAPPEQVIANFTWHIFNTIIEFIFSHSYVQRIVVEPDINNGKIHVLNLKAGFRYEKVIGMRKKTACLAFCTRDSFKQTKLIVDR